jgi:superfamily II DNA or RNA helicase
MVSVEINNVLSNIVGEVPENVIHLIKEECAYSIEGAQYSAYGAMTFCPICRKVTAEYSLTERLSPNYPTDGGYYRRCRIHGPVIPISLWDGRNFLFNAKNLSFPTGIVSKVVGVLCAQGVPFTLQDCRIAPFTRKLPYYGPELRYYQKDAVNAVLRASRGIIQAVMGSGKTLMIADLIAETGVNTVITAHTTSVFHQVYEVLKSTLKLPIGRIGDGYKDIKKITVVLPQAVVESVKTPKRKLVKGVWKTVNVSMQQIKEDYKDLFLNAEMLIHDEVHHASCDTIQLLANSAVNAYYRIGLSATPWRDDLLDVLIESVTGRKQYVYSATQAVKDGFLARPDIHIIEYKQKRQPREIMKVVKDPNTGGFVEKLTKMTYKDLYDRVVTHNDQRNDIICKIAKECYARGESILIIVRYKDHGLNIYEGLKYLDKDVRYVNGDDDAPFLRKTLDELDQKKLKIVIATGVFSEGVDIRYLNTVINTTACDSSVVAMQIVGRALRKVPGKDFVHIYDIGDTGVRWLGQHTENRKRIYQTEAVYNVIPESADIWLTKE